MAWYKAGSGNSDIGAVENLLVPTLASGSSSGISYVNNGDGTYTFNGTCTASDYASITFGTIDLSANSYKIVGIENGSSSTYYVQLIADRYYQVNDASGRQITLTEAKNSCEFRLIVQSGVALSNVIFKPMLTTNTKATYKNFVPNYKECTHGWRKFQTPNSSLSVNLTEMSSWTFSNRMGAMAVYDGCIYHVGGGSNYYTLYKWDGSAYTTLSDCPMRGYQSSVVVADDGIHIINNNYNSSTGHYVWNGSTWSELASFPVSGQYGTYNAVFFNGAIHAFYGTYHYIWKDSAWTRLDDNAYSISLDSMSACVHKGKVHFLETAHYSFDGTNWESYNNWSSATGVTFSLLSDSIKLYKLGNSSGSYNCYVFTWRNDTEGWVSLGSILNSSSGYYVRAVLYEGTIYYIGASGTGSSYSEYKYKLGDVLYSDDGTSTVVVSYDDNEHTDMNFDEDGVFYKKIV